tara:strand:- start:426 stop:2108 length:1683 start_codon:yes stop_codon:yes gene_type:complete
MANDVVIDIVANDKTKRAFGSVKAGMLGIGKLALGTATKVAKIGAAFVTAAAAATAALTKMSMTSIDNLTKTANKIGATTEALAGLQLAAELTGVSTETMNMALQRMTRRVSEAAMGTGEAVKALKELGINAYELERLPLDEQMNIVADAMQNVESQADRVRLAMKLFDSEGVALVNTLAGGSEALKEYAAEAEALGLTISDIDAAKIEAANDAVTQAKKVFTGLGNQLAVTFAPLIEYVANLFRQSAINNAEFGNIGQRVAKKLVEAYISVRKVFFELGKSVTSTKLTFLALRDAITNPLATTSILFKLKKDLDELAASEFNTEAITVAFEAIEVGAQKAAESVVKLREVQAGGSEDQKNQIDTSKFFYEAEQRGAQKLKEFTVKSNAEKTKDVLGNANKQLAIAGTQSKKMFALQKAASIASALVNTYESVTETMAAYPFPINIALSALSLAAGMAQVSAIKSQSFLGGGFTGYGARAGGLDGKGGMPAIVHPNETIIDHERGGGAGVQQTINIQTGVSQTVRAEIQNLLPEIVEISKAAIIDSNQRGGSFRNGLLGT